MCAMCFLSDPLDGKLLGQRSANATGVLQGITFAWALQTVQGLLFLFRQPNSFHLIHFVLFYIILYHVHSCLFMSYPFWNWWFVDSSTRSHGIFSQAMPAAGDFWTAASLQGGWDKGKPVAPLKLDGPGLIFMWKFSLEKPIGPWFRLGAVETINY